MSTTDAVIKIVTFCFAFGSSVFAVLLGWKDYNKRKIAEAKEKSIGAAAVERMEAEIRDVKNTAEEFKKDVFLMLFKNKLP